MLMSGLLALIKNILTVQKFGISREIEVYFAAMITLTTIERLFNVGAINDILIPSYIKIKEKENNYTAMTSFSLINNWFILVTCLVAVGFWFFAPLFLSIILPGFNQQEISQAVTILRIITVFIPLRMFNGMCSVPFMANKIYTIHEFTGIINKLVVIVLLIFLTDIYGIKILIFGTILGVIIRFFYILYLFRKCGLRYQFLLRSDKFSTNWIIGKIYIPIIQTIFLQLNRWILIGVLSVMPTGLFAIYQYVQQFYGRFSSIIIKSLGTVFLTETSTKENLFNKEWFASFLRKNSLIYFSSSLLVILIGKDLLRLIWESDKFSINDISVSYTLLVFFVFTIFFEMLRSIYIKLDTARGKIAYQYLSSIVILTVSSIILLLTVNTFGFNALIFRILFIAILSCLSSMYINYYQSKEFFLTYDTMHLLKAISQSMVVFILVQTLFNMPFFEMELNKILIFFLVCAKTLVAVVLFLIINKFLRVYNLKSIIKS